jgi:hypothetical protein
VRVLDQYQNIESQFWQYSIRWGEKDQWPRPLGRNFGNLEDFWNFLEIFGRVGKWTTVYPHGGNGSPKK